jgi:hypothetical protein
MARDSESTDFNWPLGQSGDRVLVVLQQDAELLAPILDGEPEPEDYGARRIIPLGIPSLSVDPEQLARELQSGPEDVWLCFPRSEETYALYRQLAETFVASGRVPPASALIPEPLTLEEIVRRLPSGRDAIGPRSPSRHRLLMGALTICWIANAPDQHLVPFVLGQAGAKFHEVAI